MISEETPLISSSTKHDEVYKRFEPAKKRIIVALVSVTGLLARTSSIQLSCILLYSYCISFSLRLRDFRAVDTANSQRPEYYRFDREVTDNNSFQVCSHQSIHSLAISLSILASSFGALLGASYSSFCKNPDLFPVRVQLTILNTRWQETNLPRWDTTSLCGLCWRCCLPDRRSVDGVEICSGPRSFSRFSSGVRGHWRHL